jgi:hypothetical protein
MVFNPVSDIINAFSFRKWGNIARQNDLILSQDSNGKFSCSDANNKVIISRYPTAREAVIDAITLGMLGRVHRGV